MQSWAIFSGTHMCGTMVKPSLTKCDGWCVNAQSVAKPRAAPADASSVTSRGPIWFPRTCSSTTSDRTSATVLLNGASSAQRNHRPVVFGDDEAGRVRDDLVNRPGQQVPGFEVVGDQPVHCRGVRRGRLP